MAADRVKYPRTFNLPWSNSESSDDVWHSGTLFFEGREVVVTEKVDGECTTVYPDTFMHARSVDGQHHPSQSWMKRIVAEKASEIPPGWRFCGENMYGFHSIHYRDLPSYWLVYGIYDEKNVCLSWDDTEEWCRLLGLDTVPVLYRGIWDQKKIRSLWTGKSVFDTHACKDPTNADPTFPDDFKPCDGEGYVVRVAASFPYEGFKMHAGKYVGPQFRESMRKIHWKTAAVFPNAVKEAA